MEQSPKFRYRIEADEEKTKLDITISDYDSFVKSIFDRFNVTRRPEDSYKHVISLSNINNINRFSFVFIVNAYRDDAYHPIDVQDSFITLYQYDFYSVTFSLNISNRTYVWDELETLFKLLLEEE